ncbi:stage II sporulation protein M [Alicyclobacillus fastidiosus]|uniref:Stage II sporulation protein M n=1 Tax=Alicyclobacillus fastidiosus TaxID=392011 RepID=A0ABV5AH69_9BACL|nr:stage II sporulation protein M [Alicyclobacillus fastidiosus]WEH11756.1 stage II sporulation protein M [Alicyclobacillus fastidiosus]
MKPRIAAIIAPQTLSSVRLYPLTQFVRRKAQKHLHLWTFLSGVTLCGLVFGAIVAGQLGQTDRLVLGNAIQHLFVAIKQDQLASGSQLFSQRFIADIQLLALIWLFGVSVIGIPFVIATIFLRAFTVGFAIGYTTLQFGWKGFLLSGTGIFLHQLVTFLTLFVAAVTAIRFSQQVLLQSLPVPKLTLRLTKYTGTFVLCGGGLMLGSVIQAFVVPHLLTSVIV